MELFDSDLIEKILKNDGRTMRSECSDNCPQPEGEFPPETPIGMCYVPFQKWEDIYDADTGLERGTIFRRLDLPFSGKEAAGNAK